MKDWLLGIAITVLVVGLGVLLGCILEAHLGAATLYFGMPNSCPVPGHGGPPCNMEKCAALGKNGTKTGNNCSKYCAKTCCLCSDACPKEQNQSPDQGEGWLKMGFGD